MLAALWPCALMYTTGFLAYNNIGQKDSFTATSEEDTSRHIPTMSFPRKAKNPEKAAILKIIIVFWHCSIKILTSLRSFAKNWIPAFAGMTSESAEMTSERNFCLHTTTPKKPRNDVRNDQSSRYLMFMNACILTGAIIALAANLFTMFIGYEVLTLCTVPLIVHNPDKKVITGLFTYLKILMVTGLVLFLPAIIIIYTKVGYGEFTNNGFLTGNFSDTCAIILLLMFVFGISKTALYPFHKWLPAAMVASYPVSALLHAVVVVKAGLFCLYKVLVYVFGLGYLQHLFKGHDWLIYLPIITIIYSSLQALRNDKIKMILAYSTINQLSVALLGAFLFTPKGVAAAVIHMASHSLTKICLFYAAGNMYSLKAASNVREIAGIYRTMPKSSFALLIAGLSLIGMPPFAGFVSKFFIMTAAAEAENLPVMIALIISTTMSAIYMTRILIFVYKPVSINVTKGAQDEEKLPPLMMISLRVCLSGVVLFFFIVQMMNKFLIYL
jgi:multicomponent Na+:H+ antiporter subunit D